MYLCLAHACVQWGRHVVAERSNERADGLHGLSDPADGLYGLSDPADGQHGLNGPADRVSADFTSEDLILDPTTATQ